MLQKFGFSQYESKVYEVLSASGEPLDATLIVKYSGVPKAKVYEVISRMIEKGLVLDSVSEKKKLYTALPLHLVIEKLTKEFQVNIDQLKSNSSKKVIMDDRVWSLKVEALVVGDVVEEIPLTTLYIFSPNKEHRALEKNRLIIIDEETILFAGVENSAWQAMVTKSKPFVKFFAEFFYHDVALTKITKKYEKQLMKDEEIKHLLLRLRY